MQETDIVKSTNKIEENLKNINEQSRNYIKDVLTLINKEIGVNKIISILLFGSQRAKSDVTAVSDCDLLIIFKNRVSNHHIKEIERYFIALEIKHNFRDFSDKLSKNILGVISQTTGIFVSHFLTKTKYWQEANFHKIFRVNKVFSTLFAPRNIVLGSVVTNSTTLYGKELRDKIRPRIQIKFIEMIKSTIMNLMISLFSILLTLFKRLQPIKYQLEAIKWALKASNFYCYRDSESLKEITERFISFEKNHSQKRARHFYTDFLTLRKAPVNKFSFMIRCPIRIIKIHVKAITYRRYVGRMKKLKVTPKRFEPVVPDHTFPLTL